MAKTDKVSIKKWKPYETAFEVTSGILREINELALLRSSNPAALDPSHRYTSLLSELRLPLSLNLFKGNATPSELLGEMFDLMKTNMERLYDDSKFYGGWDDRKKFSELKYYRTHIIALFNDSSLVGFASYRFVVMREYQDPTPVLYIYELQIKEAFRNNRLGRFLVRILEVVASSLSCTKLMCTVLKSNERALSFYLNKCKFTSDESDPDTHYKVLKFELPSEPQ